MVSRLGAPLCFLDTHPPLQRLFLLDLDYIGIALHHFSQAHFGGRASSPFTAYFRSSAGLAFLSFSVLQKKASTGAQALLQKFWVYTWNWDRISEILFVLGLAGLLGVLTGLRAIILLYQVTQTLGFFFFLLSIIHIVDG